MDEPSDLHLIESPTYEDVQVKLWAFQQAHQVMVGHARIGGLVSTFSNEELHSLCEFGLLTIGDVLDLRGLGLLAPDEGWTGGPHPKCEHRQNVGWSCKDCGGRARSPVRAEDQQDG